MNLDQQLNEAAKHYKAQGYQVVVRPDREVLPPFAKDFKVELLAERADGNVLASAKGSPFELEADPNITKYVEITDQQPGWRFDVFVLGRDGQEKSDKEKAKEPTEEEILRGLNDVQQMLGAGFVEPSLVAAWAALEAAMRKQLRSRGEKVGWGTSPRTMLNELYSEGVLSTRVLRDLEGLFQSRSAIVHGFAAPSIEPSAVQFLVDMARRLLTESQPVKQPA